MRQIRNFSIRLAITYIAFSVLLLLPGISIVENLFAIWAAALAFTLLSIVLRPILLALTLPFIILSGGLFIFVVDGVLLLLTGLVSGLEVLNPIWALLGVIVLGIVNIWVQGIFRRIGWLDKEGNVEDDIDENVVVSRNPNIWLRLLLLGMLLMGILFSYDMTRQIFIAGLVFNSNIKIVLALALIAWAAIALGIAWLVAEGLALDRRALFTVATLVFSAVPLAVLIRFSLFTPLPTASVAAPVAERVQYWETPDGFRLGYWHIPATTMAPESNPILFLHGGHGFAISQQDIDYFTRFAEHGHDVYLYDRIGRGASDRQVNIQDYTIDKDLDDLEFIRETLDADQLILITHSEGSDLAIHYLDRHPDRVERIAMLAPTPLVYDQVYIFDYGRTAGFDEVSALDLRIEMATDVAYYRPEAAETIATQAEVNQWYQTFFDPRIMVCPGDADDINRDAFGQLNLYADIAIERSLNLAPDISEELLENTTPVIILRPICDYSPWDTVLQYRDVLPNMRTYIIPDAGSMAYLSAPDTVEDVIGAFLKDEEPTIQPYTQRDDPWTVLENIPLPDTE